MKYRILLSDIDGTLRPFEQPRVPQANVEAIRTIQRYGVKFAISTGRGRGGIPAEMLNGLAPDYWICAAGAQVLDAAGRTIASSSMAPEELEALLSFCTEGGYSLHFSFSDGTYSYIGYEEIHRRELELGLDTCMKDGSDQTRHLREMPFSASARMPREAAARFQALHGGLGLRFLYYNDDGCDIVRAQQDKSTGLKALLSRTGMSLAECVCVGDGNNDVGILRAAGLGFCVEGGAPDALAAADRICPPSSACGVAEICRQLWPEAFARGNTP